MTRLRVVSRTGATSAVVLLLPAHASIDAHVGCAGASGTGNSSTVNTFGSAMPVAVGRSPSRTIHVGADLSQE